MVSLMFAWPSALILLLSLTLAGLAVFRPYLPVTLGLRVQSLFRAGESGAPTNGALERNISLKEARTSRTSTEGVCRT